MSERNNSGQEKGLAARHLILLFLAGVAVCAVFFSLGFLVGYNERSSRAALDTERVTGPSATPPLVNPPRETAASRNNKPSRETASNAAQPEASEISRQSAGGKIISAASGRQAQAEVPSEAGAAEGESVGANPGDEVRTGYTVQVTALRAQQDAEALVGILKSRGYPVVLVSPEFTHANDNLYRVQVGPFGSREEAEKVRAKLAKEGLFKDLFIKH